MLSIYVLELEQNKYYVGKTTNFAKRTNEHFEGDGAEWTKLYKPIKVHELYQNCDPYDEDKYTIKTMAKYGINNVRGGSFCKIHLNDADYQTISKMLNSATDRCYFCGKMDHFVKDCPEKIQQQNTGFFGGIANTISGFLNIFSSNQNNKLNQPGVDDNCNRCGKKGHWAKECHSINDIDGTPINDNNTCNRCGKQGHWARDCFATKDMNNNFIKDEDDNLCNRCGKGGHWARECHSTNDINGNWIN